MVTAAILENQTQEEYLISNKNFVVL